MDTVSPVETKRCTRCKCPQPIDQFYRDRTSADGRGKQCIPCFRARYQGRRDAGVCTGCGVKPNEPGQATCAECRDKQRRALRKVYHRKIATGRCGSCGEPIAPPAHVCDGCRARARAKRELAIRDGKCLKCASPATNGSQLCVRCWFRRMARKHLGSASLAAELQSIWDRQGGMCALSGLPMRHGVDASIDHILARARGGTSDLGNLRWLRTEVNIAKRTMSDSEFVAMCRSVVELATRHA